MKMHQALDARVDVIRPVGSLVGGPESDEIVELGKQLTAQGKRALLVDLDDVESVNSLGLGALTRVVIAYSRANGSVKVCNVKGRVRKLFDIVRFNVLFTYYDSEPAALEAFAKETFAPA